MSYWPKWGDLGGWLSDEVWINLLGDNGAFDAKVLATVAWTANDHTEERWNYDELVEQCAYHLDSSSDDIRAAFKRLVTRSALPADVLTEYEDQPIDLEGVHIAIAEFLQSTKTEQRLVEAVGLHQAQADHLALLKIFKLDRPAAKPRLAPGESMEEILGTAEAPLEANDLPA